MTEVGEPAKAAGAGQGANDGKKEKAADWFEIQLLDGEGNPVKDRKIGYNVDLREGRKLLGRTLDGDGKARVEGVKPGAHRVSFPDLPDDHWVGSGAATEKSPKHVVVMTGQKTEIKLVPRVEHTFQCLKYRTKALTVGTVPVHFCKVYLFYELRGTDGKKSLSEDKLTFSAGEKPCADLSDKEGEEGKCSRKLVKGATYHCYFAGKDLTQAEIDELRGDKRHFLVEVKAQGRFSIPQSFFWWIALLQRVEAVVADPLDVLTKVRKLYYDERNWNLLIDREATPPLYTHDENGVVTQNDPVDLPVVFALGRTYLMSGNRFVMADTGLTGNTFRPSRWGERPERMRTLDRHDFILLPDGKATQIGHVLAGLESARFGPSTVGGVEFDHPRTATTWSGDLGQAVFVAKTYGGNKADWDKARLEAAPEVEIFGDIHGDVLGRDWAALLGGKKLSRVLEEYFYDPRRDPQAQASFLGGYGMSKGDLQAAAQGQGLGKLATVRTHIESFAETWDSNKWDNFNAEADAAIVDFSLTYFAEQLLALDP